MVEEKTPSIKQLGHKFTKDELDKYFSVLAKPDEAAEYLAEVLGLDTYRFDARQAIQLDYASQWLEFAMQQGYGPERTASLMNIAFFMFNVVAIRAVPFAEAETALRGALLRLTSPAPGADGPTFSPDQMARVASCFAQGLFRHASLYKYVFSEEQGHHHMTVQLLVETPLVPSFEGALTQQHWEAYHEERRQEAEAQRKAEEDVELARQAEAALEAQRLAEEEAERLRLEELARKPATLDEAIVQLVALRLEKEKDLMQEEFKRRGEGLVAKVEALEAFAAGGKPLSATKK